MIDLMTVMKWWNVSIVLIDKIKKDKNKMEEYRPNIYKIRLG